MCCLFRLDEGAVSFFRRCRRFVRSESVGGTEDGVNVVCLLRRFLVTTRVDAPLPLEDSYRGNSGIVGGLRLRRSKAC